MIKPILLSFVVGIALARAAALAEASGGYVGAPLPPVLPWRNPCDGVLGATPLDRRRLVRVQRRNGSAPAVSRSCCLSGMRAEGGGF